MANKRVFFAIQSAGIATAGSTNYTSIHGLQNLGVNTKFTLEQVFEIGQLEIYQNVETLPDVDVSVSKILDGRPLIYHLATYGAPDATLVGRSTARSSLAFDIFGDTQNSASGTPVAQCVLSGVFVQSLSYDFKTTANSMETVTMVGNSKQWQMLASGVNYVNDFNNTDSPLAPEGVNRREHFQMGLCYFPKQIPGISSSGTNDLQPDGNFGVHVESVKVSANLGRENLLELGRKLPYFRYVAFPVEVKCDIEIIAVSGDMISATEAGVYGSGHNIIDETIYLRTQEGTKIDLGSKCKLASVNYTGAAAGNRGSNSMISYSYQTWNQLTVTHPQDPTAALAQ